MLDLPLGRTFTCAFGLFVPQLTFVGSTSLRIEIPTADWSTIQTVSTEVTEVRPGVALLSWIEEDGTTVVHVQDYEAGVVYSHAHLPDGTLVRSKGSISWL